jgi:hypothetical protein
MYLDAAVRLNPVLSPSTEVFLLSYGAGHTVVEMLEDIVSRTPDVVGFSCQGWSFRHYTLLFDLLREFLPEIRIVLGGNHVSYRGAELLHAYPSVDVVVNGEGERTFCDLLRYLVDGIGSLGVIPGITYRDESGPATTEERPRFKTLDEVPSAYLPPAVQLETYDIALLETNRGCPYACSFCYWGGAVGQKLSRATLERMSVELDQIGAAGVHTLFICDANFGILEQDLEIAHLLVEVRRRHGAPRTLHVNWAKNHAARVGAILDLLHEGGIHSNVFLALQTTSKTALSLAGRDERGRREMFDLADRLIREDRRVGCELIFGLPGDTLDDFRASYDKLFLSFPSVLVHPLWILPNTSYDRRRRELGIITLRPGGETDYEGLLQHDTLSREENREGLALLLGEEILVGSGYARTTIRCLAQLSPWTATACISAFERFVATREEVLATGLHEAFQRIRRQVYFDRALRSQLRQLIFEDREKSRGLLLAFLDMLELNPELKQVCAELARLDCALLPRSELAGEGSALSSHLAPFDIHEFSRRLLLSQSIGVEWVLASPATELTLRHPAGYARFRGEAIDLTGTWEGTVAESRPMAAPWGLTPTPPVQEEPV